MTNIFYLDLTEERRPSLVLPQMLMLSISPLPSLPLSKCLDMGVDWGMNWDTDTVMELPSDSWLRI